MSWRTFIPAPPLSASSAADHTHTITAHTHTAANHTHTITGVDWGGTQSSAPWYEHDENLSATVSAWLRAQRRDARRSQVRVAYDPGHGMWRLTVFRDDGTRGYGGPAPIVHTFSAGRVREQRGSGLMFICQEALAQFERFPKTERKPRQRREKAAAPVPLRVARRMSFRKEGA